MASRHISLRRAVMELIILILEIFDAFLVHLASSLDTVGTEFSSTSHSK